MKKPIICPNGHIFSCEETIVQTDETGKKILQCPIEGLYYPKKKFREIPLITDINKSVIEFGAEFDRIKEENTTLTSWKERLDLPDDVEELRIQLQNSSIKIKQLEDEKTELLLKKSFLVEENKKAERKDKENVQKLASLDESVQTKDQEINRLNNEIKKKDIYIIYLNEQVSILKEQMEKSHENMIRMNSKMNDFEKKLDKSYFLPTALAVCTLLAGLLFGQKG